MIPMTMVAISCSANIYLYYSNPYDKLFKKPTVDFDTRDDMDTSEVFIDTSEEDFNKLGGNIQKERKLELANEIRSLIY